LRHWKDSFDAAKLAENAHAVIDAVCESQAGCREGQVRQEITLTSTMGPGITIDLTNWRRWPPRRMWRETSGARL